MPSVVPRRNLINAEIDVKFVEPRPRIGSPRGQQFLEIFLNVLMRIKKFVTFERRQEIGDDADLAGSGAAAAGDSDAAERLIPASNVNRRRTPDRACSREHVLAIKSFFSISFSSSSSSPPSSSSSSSSLSASSSFD